MISSQNDHYQEKKNKKDIETHMWTKATLQKFYLNFFNMPSVIGFPCGSLCSSLRPAQLGKQGIVSK
jgi:hypothetical protein